ncbi:hypothetical protein K2173_021410 [Erythroxylum novogranatense]|uniref:Cytochrome P450 n=1 Tax=Erythroxylum novogranatense TaxID=1862640 RepID=A0AAV8TYI7_9ROSI|nr:hypothetical protein K2173_021410 [Erythroxylum novogranatense]
MEVSVLFMYLFLSLIFLFVALKFYQSNIRRTNLPPSPRSLPIIGHLHLLKPPMHRTLHKLAKIYGPIYSLRFGSQLVVVVSSSAAAEECFTKNDIVLANRPKLFVGKLLGYNYTTLTQAPYGDHWRNLRRVGAIEIFSAHRLNVLSNIRQDEVKRLVARLSRDSRHDFALVELKSMFQELTFNIMMRMVAGKRYYGDNVSDENEAKRFRGIMRELVSFGGTSNPGDFLPILNWIDGGKFKKSVTRLANETDKFLQGLIDEHRTTKGDLKNKNTIIGHLLSLQESHPEYYTDEIIKGFILVLLLAGTDTSSITMEWAMTNLLNNPTTLMKAREELDTEVGDECLVDEPTTFKLPYLKNIIFETLRLFPAAPLLVPHMASDDCTVGNYNVPQGTILLVNAWTIHRDPTLWDKPTDFVPERFDGGDGESHKLMPFGLGRRSCPGSGLAQRVVGLTLATLVQCFDWRRVDDTEIDMTEGKGITMHKIKPLEALCKSRPIINKILS